MHAKVYSNKDIDDLVRQLRIDPPVFKIGDSLNIRNDAKQIVYDRLAEGEGWPSSREYFFQKYKNKKNVIILAIYNDEAGWWLGFNVEKEDGTDAVTVLPDTAFEISTPSYEPKHIVRESISDITTVVFRIDNDSESYRIINILNKHEEWARNNTAFIYPSSYQVITYPAYLLFEYDSKEISILMSTLDSELDNQRFNETILDNSKVYNKIFDKSSIEEFTKFIETGRIEPDYNPKKIFRESLDIITESDNDLKKYMIYKTINNEEASKLQMFLFDNDYIWIDGDESVESYMSDLFPVYFIINIKSHTFSRTYKRDIGNSSMIDYIAINGSIDLYFKSIYDSSNDDEFKNMVMYGRLTPNYKPRRIVREKVEYKYQKICCIVYTRSEFEDVENFLVDRMNFTWGVRYNETRVGEHATIYADNFPIVIFADLKEKGITRMYMSNRADNILQRVETTIRNLDDDRYDYKVHSIINFKSIVENGTYAPTYKPKKIIRESLSDQEAVDSLRNSPYDALVIKVHDIQDSNKLFDLVMSYTDLFNIDYIGSMHGTKYIWIIMKPMFGFDEFEITSSSADYVDSGRYKTLKHNRKIKVMDMEDYGNVKIVINQILGGKYRDASKMYKPRDIIKESANNYNSIGVLCNSSSELTKLQGYLFSIGYGWEGGPDYQDIRVTNSSTYPTGLVIYYDNKRIEMYPRLFDEPFDDYMNEYHEYMNIETRNGNPHIFDYSKEENMIESFARNGVLTPTYNPRNIVRESASFISTNDANIIFKNYDFDVMLVKINNTSESTEFIKYIESRTSFFKYMATHENGYYWIFFKDVESYTKGHILWTDLNFVESGRYLTVHEQITFYDEILNLGDMDYFKSQMEMIFAGRIIKNAKKMYSPKDITRESKDDGKYDILIIKFDSLDNYNNFHHEFDYLTYKTSSYETYGVVIISNDVKNGLGYHLGKNNFYSTMDYFIDDNEIYNSYSEYNISPIINSTQTDIIKDIILYGRERPTYSPRNIIRESHKYKYAEIMYRVNNLDELVELARYVLDNKKYNWYNIYNATADTIIREFNGENLRLKSLFPTIAYINLYNKKLELYYKHDSGETIQSIINYDVGSNVDLTLYDKSDFHTVKSIIDNGYGAPFYTPRKIIRELFYYKESDLLKKSTDLPDIMIGDVVKYKPESSDYFIRDRMDGIEAKHYMEYKDKPITVIGKFQFDNGHTWWSLLSKKGDTEIWIPDSILFKLPDYKPKKIIREFNEYVKNLTDNYGDEDRAKEDYFWYLNTIGNMNENGGTLYRIVFLKNIDDLNKDDLGEHWSLDKDFSRTYENIKDQEEGMKPYIIIGKFEPNSIDIEQSLKSFSQLPDEQEVNIKKKPIDFKIDLFKR